MKLGMNFHCCFFTVAMLFSCAPNVNYEYTKDLRQKKKILILTNGNGGGHNAAAEALKAAIEDGYGVEIFDILQNRIVGEWMFAYASRKEYWTFLEYLIKIKAVSEFINSSYYGGYIFDTIVKKRPDLVISVFPIGIKKYKEVTDLLNIPYAVIPTDFNGDDLTYYGIAGFENDPNNAKMFRFFLPFENKRIKAAIDGKTVQHSIRYVGYPTRKDFLDFSNKYRKNPLISDEIKAIEGIKPEDKTILITMGAQSWAEDSVVNYTNIINNKINNIIKDYDGALHLYITCGANKDLAKKINSIELKNKDKLKIHTQQWIGGKRMAELMAISDLIIAKPGGSTVGEILAIGKYTIFKPDSTISMPWERSNMLTVENYHLSDRLPYNSDFDENVFIVRVVNGLSCVRLPSDKLPPENHFYRNIRKEIDNMWII